MEYLDLLDRSDAHLFRILKWIELKQLEHKDINELCDIFDVSRFKAKQYLSQLNEIISNENEAYITYDDFGKISSIGVDLILVKKMLVVFAERSNLFRLFCYVFEEEKSLSSFREKEYLSRTKSYELQRTLKSKISEDTFNVEKNQLVGDELKIRKNLFSIYYEIYNGVKRPFSENKKKEIYELINLLRSNLQINLTKTNEIKLFYFIGIMLIRIENGHIQIGDLSQLPATMKLNDENVLLNFYKLKKYSKKKLQKEWELLLLFMYCEEIINETSSDILVIEYSIDQRVTKIVEDIFSKTINQSNVENKHYDILKQRYYKEVIKTHLNYKLFHFSTESFSLQSSFFFFEETYPNVANTLVAVINDNFKNCMDRKSRIRIYHDYLFAYLRIVPVSLVEDKIYVCVDFSHSTSYTSYIVEQILQFKNLNIEIQDRVTAKTQLYISDLWITEISCNQIVWKNPPTSEDWETFGDAIVKIKQGEN